MKRKMAKFETELDRVYIHASLLLKSCSQMKYNTTSLTSVPNFPLKWSRLPVTLSIALSCCDYSVTSVLLWKDCCVLTSLKALAGCPLLHDHLKHHWKTKTIQKAFWLRKHTVAYFRCC